MPYMELPPLTWIEDSAIIVQGEPGPRQVTRVVPQWVCLDCYSVVATEQGPERHDRAVHWHREGPPIWTLH